MLLIGYYGHGNFGDDLILETLIRVLSPVFQLAATDYGCYTSRDIKGLEEKKEVKQIGIYTERRKFLSKLNVFIQPAQIIWHGAKQDIVAFGGGTQLFETRKNGVLPLISDAIHVIVLKNLFRVKIVHIFVGINTPRTKIGSFILRLILKNSDLLILRDKKSHELCLSLGVKKDKIILAHDTVYLRENLPERSEKTNSKELLLGISIFPYFTHIEGNPAADVEYLQKVKKFVAELSDCGKYHVRIFFFGSQSSGSLNDIVYAKSIATQFEKYQIQFIEYKQDTNAYLISLAQMDIVIAMRLHVLIAAALVKVKQIISLPYQAKVVEESKDLGVSDLGKSEQIITKSLIEGEAIISRKRKNQIALSILSK